MQPLYCEELITLDTVPFAFVPGSWILLAASVQTQAKFNFDTPGLRSQLYALARFAAGSVATLPRDARQS
jgi:hypothetical protein